ncbi:MAG: hypothetical protein Q7V20_08305 [Aquabacterium sp.]|uniref:hypothetical protein n=1 Tax=Aquabacterium sp. TaxID=1872578 RepID=UPI0027232EEB|nr:hypothetical protein [Aquabacterium sp.]MDO9003436.1 hypothetical protein [Aquabacterium sp.]
MSTTNSPQVNDYLQYANLQMAAEAFLRNGDTKYYQGEALGAALVLGNNHASRFIRAQVNEFSSKWDVIEQIENTPTGFSGTLFQNKSTHEYVISFRSTEFIDDSVRDNRATHIMEVKEYGFALGQIRDMASWYASLKEEGKIPVGQQISVTGYSLGGHLATAFNMLLGGRRRRLD